MILSKNRSGNTCCQGRRKLTANIIKRPSARWPAIRARGKNGGEDMLLSKRRFRFVQRVIASWESENVITSGEADRLRASIELAKFDWKRLARYSFWLAGVSLGIAIFSLIFDDTVLGIIMKILAIPDILISVLFAVFSAGFYYWGFRRKKRKPARK